MAQVHRFANGLTLALEEQPWNPGVSAVLLIPAGATTDPPELSGAASVLESWLWKGTQKRSAQELAGALDALGVQRDGGAGSEYTSLVFSFLADALAPVLAIYAELLRQPAFPLEGFAQALALAHQELASLEDRPARKLSLRLRREVFESPHGQSVLGSEETLAALTPELLESEYHRRYSPNGAILALAGGLEFETTKAMVAEAFGEWSGSEPEFPEVVLTPVHSLRIDKSTAQAQIGLIYPDIGPEDPDFYTDRLALQILSGGMSSRLFTEVREKRGLVYSVSARPTSMKGFSYIYAYAGTTPERAEETLQVLQSEIEQMSAGVTADELERAKVGLRAGLVMQQESSRARAQIMAGDLFLMGRVRPLEEVEQKILALDLQTVNHFLATHLYRDPWIGTLGPASLELSE
jgi:predicted Zn-dependent peptidase